MGGASPCASDLAVVPRLYHIREATYYFKGWVRQWSACLMPLHGACMHACMHAWNAKHELGLAPK
jgi:hypothetical protein